MGLKQLSVFLENSPGRLHEVTAAFGEAGINLRALSLADTAGFGVLRLLVSDLAKARTIAMQRHWPARVDDVVAVRIPDVPGSLARLLQPLGGKRIDVEYMYAFTGFTSGEAVMIFRFRNHEVAKQALVESGAQLLGAQAFGLLEGDDG
jgi:hypothetical protein